SFFFSSRGRHTRFSRDWSSDVCSSDLGVFQEVIGQRLARILRQPARPLRDGAVSIAGLFRTNGGKVGAQLIYLRLAEALGCCPGRQHAQGNAVEPRFCLMHFFLQLLLFLDLRWSLDQALAAIRRAGWSAGLFTK